MAKARPRSVDEVMKSHKATASRDLAAVKAALPATNGNNRWLEIGVELDKHLGAPLLKFTKQGEFAISDIDVIPDGTRCVAHCDLTELGWTKWQDGKPVDRKVGLVADGFVPPPKAALPDRDESTWEIQDDGTRRDPWSFQMSVPITRLDAGGETYTFTVGSKGGLRCLSALTRAYGKHIADGKTGLPVVTLTADSYKHRQYGKIFFPTLPIVGWTNDSGKPQTLAEDLNDEIPANL